MGVDGSGDVAAMIDSVKARSRTIVHVAEQVAVRLDPSRSTRDSKGEALIRKMGDAFAANLSLAAAALASLGPSEWKPDRLLETLRAVAEANTLKLGDVMQPIRVALTGSTVSEPVNELLAVVGAEKSLQRIRQMARLPGGGVSAA